METTKAALEGGLRSRRLAGRVKSVMRRPEEALPPTSELRDDHPLEQVTVRAGHPADAWGGGGAVAVGVYGSGSAGVERELYGLGRPVVRAP